MFEPLVVTSATSSNKCHASSNKCLTSSNKCLTSSNKDATIDRPLTWQHGAGGALRPLCCTMTTRWTRERERETCSAWMVRICRNGVSSSVFLLPCGTQQINGPPRRQNPCRSTNHQPNQGRRQHLPPLVPSLKRLFVPCACGICIHTSCLNLDSTPEPI